MAGLLALGLILGSTPGAQAAEDGTQGTVLTGPAEEAPASLLLPLEPAVSEPSAPASADQYLAALDRLLALGLSQEEADSLWLRQGAAGIETCLQGEGAAERLSLLRLSFAHPERLDRYQAELARSPELSPEEAVVRVNIGLDTPPYGAEEPVDEPASLTALVNKYHALPADYVPELELLPSAYTASQGARLRPEAHAAFLQMADAAAEEGLRLYSASPYRSYAAQERVYQRYAAQQGVEAADTYSARAGFSEHQTGLALDINVASLSAHFEETPEYAWLAEHCWEYGFILRFPQGKEALTGYLFEPWHYRYVGPETARLCHEQNWTLEEYWARQPACGTGPAVTLAGEPLSFSRTPPRPGRGRLCPRRRAGPGHRLGRHGAAGRDPPPVGRPPAGAALRGTLPALRRKRRPPGLPGHSGQRGADGPGKGPLSGSGPPVPPGRSRAGSPGTRGYLGLGPEDGPDLSGAWAHPGAGGGRAGR